MQAWRRTVEGLGADPDAMLRSFPRGPIGSSSSGYDLYVLDLLEYSAVVLDRPDLGMLTARAEAAPRVLEPIDAVMRYADTVADALRYCAEHIQICSPMLQMSLEEAHIENRWFLRLDITSAGLAERPQAIEHILLVIHDLVGRMTAGGAVPSEVWLGHKSLAPRETYRKNFARVMRYEQASSGLFFSESALNYQNIGADPRIHQFAQMFIDSLFLLPQRSATNRVRAAVARLLLEGRCSTHDIADALHLHPRTLQRQLREENTTVELVRDGVRRDVARRYLAQPDISLSHISDLLDYSEIAVFSRSCRRWFGASPSEVRKILIR